MGARGSFSPRTWLWCIPKRSTKSTLLVFTPAAALLDWIFQVLAKGWAQARTMYYLLHAFNDILQPQRHYCSWSAEIRTDGGKLARMFAEQPLVNDIGPEMVPRERNDWVVHNESIVFLIAAVVGRLRHRVFTVENIRPRLALFGDPLPTHNPSNPAQRRMQQPFYPKTAATARGSMGFQGQRCQS